jgi:hypothetical protein
MRWLGGPLVGHLGSAVSPLVDGQLDPDSAERAWAHAVGCPLCRDAVEREVWVKRSLATMAGADPSSGLTSALHELPWQAAGAIPPALPPATPPATPPAEPAPWSAVAELERRSRLGRGGLLAAGAGTVSAAVLGIGAVSGVIDLEPWSGRPTETTIGNAPAP